MHVSTHRPFVPSWTSPSPAPKPVSQAAEFSEVAHIAEDLKGGKRGGFGRKSRYGSFSPVETESAAFAAAANESSWAVNSSAAARAAFDLTTTDAVRSGSQAASPREANGPLSSYGPVEERSLADLLTLIASAA